MILFGHGWARLDHRNMINTTTVPTPLHRTSGDMVCHAGDDTDSTIWAPDFHIGRFAPTRCHGVRLGMNWRREALPRGWLVASDTTSGANGMCADLSRNANKMRTDL